MSAGVGTVVLALLSDFANVADDADGLGVRVGAWVVGVSEVSAGWEVTLTSTARR
jgi:hypothetical protein